MPNPLKSIRLIPLVIVLAAGLLVLKGWGIAIEARAQTASAPHPAPTPSVAKSEADPAADPAETVSASSVDLLTSLGKRRAALDARERDLVMRSNLIDAAAKRVDERIAELKSLQASIQTLLGQRDIAEQKQLDALVKSYSSMKPADAARIFNSLADEVLVPVAAAMKPDVLGAVLAKMNSEDAQKLTVKLANRLKAKVEPQPQQLAANSAPVAMPPQQSPQATPVPADAQAPSAQQASTAPAPAAAAPQSTTPTPAPASATPAPKAASAK
ncbi:MAG TPA: hypothetical protein VLV55_12740 [Rhizomicrobium sp.]|nr:hypothetical protein [Rhizomicrobium sp.]